MYLKFDTSNYHYPYASSSPIYLQQFTDLIVVMRKYSRYSKRLFIISFGMLFVVGNAMRHNFGIVPEFIYLIFITPIIYIADKKLSSYFADKPCMTEEEPSAGLELLLIGIFLGVIYGIFDAFIFRR